MRMTGTLTPRDRIVGSQYVGTRSNEFGLSIESGSEGRVSKSGGGWSEGEPLARGDVQTMATTWALRISFTR